MEILINDDLSAYKHFARDNNITFAARGFGMMLLQLNKELTTISDLAIFNKVSISEIHSHLSELQKSGYLTFNRVMKDGGWKSFLLIHSKPIKHSTMYNGVMVEDGEKWVEGMNDANIQEYIDGGYFHRRIGIKEVAFRAGVTEKDIKSTLTGTQDCFKLTGLPKPAVYGKGLPTLWLEADINRWLDI